MAILAGLAAVSLNEEIIVDVGKGKGREVIERGRKEFRKSQSITEDSIQFLESVNYREHTILRVSGNDS